MNGDIHNVISLESLWGREPRDGSNTGWLEISVNIAPFYGSSEVVLQKNTYYLDGETFDPFLVDLMDQIQKLRYKLSKEKEDKSAKTTVESSGETEA